MPYLEQILRDFPADRLAALRRGIACVWPRLFWTGRFDAAEPLEPVPAECGRACRAQLAALAPADAFSTLMWLLRRRLQTPRPNAAFEARPGPLRDQPWLSLEAPSCWAALEAEGELERAGQLPAWVPTLGSHGVR